MVVLTVFGFSNVALYLLLNKVLGGSYLESLRTLYLLEQNLPFYLSVMGLLQILFILVLTLVITLLISHQIAGPIFRYEDTLGKIASGILPEQVETRKTDQLKPMVNSLNDLSISLRGVYGSAQALNDLLASSSELDIELLKKRLERVRANMGVHNSVGEQQ